jgi:hypothetical protein
MHARLVSTEYISVAQVSDMDNFFWSASVHVQHLLEHTWRWLAHAEFIRIQAEGKPGGMVAVQQLLQIASRGHPGIGDHAKTTGSAQGRHSLHHMVHWQGVAGEDRLLEDLAQLIHHLGIQAYLEFAKYKFHELVHRQGAVLCPPDIVPDHP